MSASDGGPSGRRAVLVDGPDADERIAADDRAAGELGAASRW
ncbi:hypothetical protein [Geodermatophilus sp. URMC 60]